MAESIKRMKQLQGAKADMPTLLKGEFGFCDDVDELYIGNGTANIEIANLNKTTLLTNTQYYTSKLLPQISNITTVETIQTEYDSMIDAYPDYISKTLLGKDESDTYDIYMYDFKPPNYKNTVILIGFLHGNERYGGLSLLYGLKSICEDWGSNSILADLRWNTRFKVIGLANPWGVNNTSRLNVNDVDINRNFEYTWEASADATKGSAALSEVETQYINNLITSTPEAIAFLDFHCGPHDGKNWVLYQTSNARDMFYKTYQCTKTILQMMLDRNPGSTGEIKISSYPDHYPTGMAQAVAQKAMPVGITVEWGDSSTIYSPISDPKNWTKCVEFAINSIYITIQTSLSNLPYTQNFLKSPVWDNMPTNRNKTTLVEMFDDFQQLIENSTDLKGWVINKVETGAGDSVVSLIDDVGGWIQLANDDALNDYTKIQYSSSPFKIVPNKRLAFETKIKVATETPTSLVFEIGLQVKDAELLKNGIFFRKSSSSPDDVIRCMLYAGNTYQTYSTVVLESDTEYKLGIFFDGLRIYYYINDNLAAVRDHQDMFDSITPTFSVQNGSALAGNKLLIDYVKVAQER